MTAAVAAGPAKWHRARQIPPMHKVSRTAEIGIEHRRKVSAIPKRCGRLQESVWWQLGVLVSCVKVRLDQQKVSDTCIHGQLSSPRATWAADRLGTALRPLGLAQSRNSLSVLTDLSSLALILLCVCYCQVLEALRIQSGVWLTCGLIDSVKSRRQKRSKP